MKCNGTQRVASVKRRIRQFRQFRQFSQYNQHMATPPRKLDRSTLARLGTDPSTYWDTWSVQGLLSRKDFEAIFGYALNPQFELYKYCYRRMPLANAAVNLFADSIWGESPTIYSKSNKAITDTFNKWAEEQKLWLTITDAYKLALIGRYSIIFLQRMGSGGKRGLAASPTGPIVGVRAYDETMVRVRLDQYGDLEKYEIRTKDQSTGAAATTDTLHPDRLIHVAFDSLGSNSQYLGSPILERVLNNVYDALKVLGAASESTWRSCIALGIMSTEMEAAPTGKEGMASSLAEIMDGVKRTGVFSKSKIDFHQPKEVTGAILDYIIEQVCISLQIPKRIFTGSERGELASSQDQTTWTDTLNRKRRACELKILRPLVNELMATGTLPEIADYEIVWDRQKSETEMIETELKIAEVIEKHGRVISVLEDEGLRTLILDRMRLVLEQSAPRE